MNLIGVLVPAALLCWCAALLQLATQWRDPSIEDVELQLAGLGRHFSTTAWFRLRVLGSLLLAALSALLMVTLMAGPPWFMPLVMAAAAYCGWQVSRWLLRLRIRQRDSALRKELPAFVDRLTVALACGNTLRSALRLAAACSQPQGVGPLMLELLPGGRQVREAAPGTSVHHVAPAAVAAVARLIRNAGAGAEAREFEPQILQQLESWSRLRGRRAYDLPEIWQGGIGNDDERTSTILYS